MRGDDEKLRELAGALAGSPVVSLERIGRGGNSRVHLARCRDGRRYVAKTYVQPTRDGLDRLEVEFNCLRFLESRGVPGVPRPVAANPAERVALYAYLEGEAVGEAAPGDVLTMADFLLLLRDLGRGCVPADFHPASEACFSFEELLANLGRRLALLGEQGLDGPLGGDLTRFLEARLAPAVARAGDWLRSAFGGEFVSRRLPWDRRVLSPSDFGFHNALRTPSGGLAFVDFEYFGWDDPAKAVSDFLLHPAMSLSPTLKRRFVAAMLQGFGEDPDLGLRLRAAYPLFRLKWCLILLNEFLEPCFARRQAASATPETWTQACARQLAKAEAMLDGLTVAPGPGGGGNYASWEDLSS